MIISYKYRFIFIKTAKTAGTSIEVFLSPLCGEQDVFTPFSEPEDGHTPRNFKGKFSLARDLRQKCRFLGQKKSLRAFWPIREVLLQYAKGVRYYHHIPAWQVKNRLPQDIWQQYFKFCVERNPFDKVLSAWSWYNHKIGMCTTLDDYLDRFERWTYSRDHAVGMWPYNFLNYTDPKSGELLVDRIIPYERLKVELPAVFEELEIKGNFDLVPNAKGGVRKAVGYRDHFNLEQRNRVYALFKEEFDLHKYEF